MRRIATFGLLLVLAGCQSIPPINFSVPNVGYSQKKIDADLRSMTVSIARPDEQKGDFPLGMEEVPRYWQSALQEALDRMAIFKDESSKKLSLAVKILGFDLPIFGASMETTSIAQYELLDRSNGDIIYTQEVSTIGVVPFNYAFLGIVRARESANRSVQNNIAQFLQALETINVQAPMFPALPVAK